MNVYQVNLREESDACQREGIDPTSYLQIKSRLLAGLMSLQRLAPGKWTPQILDSFKAKSPTQLKEKLLSLLPLSNEESVSFDNSSLDSWFLSLCSLLEEKILIYFLAERARNIYSKHFAPRLKEIVALVYKEHGQIENASMLKQVDVFKVLSKITGKEIKTAEQLFISLDDPKVIRTIQNVLQDKAIADAIDRTVEFLNQQAGEYALPRLLDATDMAICGLFTEALIYIDTELRAAKRLPPLRDWRNKQATKLGTLKRREAINRLETIKRGIPEGVKKRPLALVKGTFKNKEEFYDALYDAIRRMSDQKTATKNFIATKYLKVKNEKQLDSILQYYNDDRTWKQIRDHALEIKK